MPQVVGRILLDSEDEKLRLLEGNLGFEAKLEGNLLKRVDEENGEVVRSRVTVGKRGAGEEEFGKYNCFVFELSKRLKFNPLNTGAAVAVAVGPRPG